MSEHEPRDPAPDEIGAIDVLDANLERLLTHTQQRAEVPSEARARMLSKLRDATQARESAQPPRPSPAANDRGHRPRRFGAITTFVAIAAALILAWVLGLGSGLFGSGQTDEQFAEYEHHELGARAITLADGSRALLRTGTKLQALGPRHLRLIAGEVLLDVGEAVEPMLVETPQGQALVLGTRLLLRSDGAETLAAVLTGSARVESKGPGAELLLRAGEQALLSRVAAAERIEGRRLSFEIDWARELLAPSETPEPVRRGNLIARAPRVTGQLKPGPEWPLPMRELTVDVHVEDGHVRTTIDQTFFNHLDRNLEGVYQFPLPPDAAIARLAMYVDGQRMEAGVVERDRGRDIYEQIVHRRRDPALLEWMQGNLFQVRIFPLPGRTEKRILLSYTAALDELYGEGQLRVPIPEIDLPVAQVNYRIRVVGAAGREFEARSHAFELGRDGDDLIAEFSESNARIGTDIVASLAAGAPGVPAPSVGHYRMVDSDGRRHHGVRLRPDLRAQLDALGATATAAPARDWIVLFDSSASRGAAELEAQRVFLGEFVDQLDGGDRIAVELFDSRVRWFGPALQSVASVDRQALAQFVARESRVGLGVTRLGEAIDAALVRLASAPAVANDGRERVPTLIYLGDGLSDGLDANDDVEDLAQRFAGRAAFVGVSVGAAYDEPALTRLAAAGDGLHVHLAEGDSLAWRALELLTTLATARVLDLEATFVDAEGQVIAAKQTHANARSLADGESLELLTRLEADAPEPVAVELRGRATGSGKAEWTHRVELPSPVDDTRWLPRTWARAEVAALTEAGVEQHAEAITQLGLAHFLVTPTTSLLVLESEAMYRDFEVHRPAEDAWARYPAPDRIEVIREAARSEAGRGQYVVRKPTQILDERWGGWGIQTRGSAATLPLVGASFGGPSMQLDQLGLVGTGRGGGGSGFGIGIGLIGSGTLPERSGGMGFGGRGVRPDVADQSKTKESPTKRGEFGGFVSTGSTRTSWATHGQQARVAEPMAGEFASVDVPFASTIVTGASISAASIMLRPGSLPWARALHYSNDWRLDDLAELVPALFEEPFDLAREQLLLSGLDGTRGSISEPAAALIDAARTAQANVRYSLPEGGVLDIDGASRFALTHDRWGFLAEQVIYDGEQLRADYPEFGLSVARAVGPTSPALLGEWVPWIVPEADHLAHFYDVVQTGPRVLKLTPIATGEPQDRADSSWLEVEFDAEHRVIALRVHVGERVASTTTFTWTDAGLVLDNGRTLTRVGPAQAIAGHPQATVVGFPLPSPADLELELAALDPGTPAWVAAQQQRLAGAAALAQLDDVRTVLHELSEHAGRVLPGELVLGGAALNQAPKPVRDAVLATAEAGPIRDYIHAGQQTGNRRLVALRKLADADELDGNPVGFMASYRTLIEESERSPGESSLRRLERFLAGYRHPTYAYVATRQLSNRWWNKGERRASAWLALAEQDNRWKYLALHQAGLAHYNHGRYSDAVAMFERAFSEAADDEQGAMPIVDWTVQGSFSSVVGHAGWQLVWTRLRERVLESGDPRLAIQFLASATALNHPDDAQRVLDRLEPDSMEPSVAIAVFDALVAHGRMSEARAVLDSVRSRDGDSPEILLRASLFAEQQGELGSAADDLERALQMILDDRGMSLAELRAGFGRLFELRARQARPLATNQQTAARALTTTLAVADRWRHEDPDNPEIDRLCAELLWSLDHDDEAWRQLSSSLDRHASDGQAIAWVADALEQAGKFERAERVWARATEVEPTDAHNHLRRAQSLLANGFETEARIVLEGIVEGDWQPRFGGDVEQAKRLLRALDR